MTGIRISGSGERHLNNFLLSWGKCLFCFCSIWDLTSPFSKHSLDKNINSLKKFYIKNKYLHSDSLQLYFTSRFWRWATQDTLLSLEDTHNRREATHNRREATRLNQGHILPKQVAIHQQQVATPLQQVAIHLQQEASPHRQADTHPRQVVTHQQQGVIHPRGVVTPLQLEASLPKLVDTLLSLEQEVIHPCLQQVRLQEEGMTDYICEVLFFL